MKLQKRYWARFETSHKFGTTRRTPMVTPVYGIVVGKVFLYRENPDRDEPLYVVKRGAIFRSENKAYESLKLVKAYAIDSYSPRRIYVVKAYKDSTGKLVAYQKSRVDVFSTRLKASRVLRRLLLRKRREVVRELRRIDNFILRA